MKKFGLGKGLDALIPTKTEDLIESVKEIEISSISPNPYQPRQNITSESLGDLAESIKNQGVIQPVILRRKDDGFELISGERRLRAAEMVGLKTIPAIIRECTDEDMLSMALIENLQREDLNPIEEAKSYHKLIEEFGWTQEEISRNIGKSRVEVANTLRLLKLPEQIKQDLIEGRLSKAHGRTLLSIEEERVQLKIADKIKRKKLSVREVEKLVKDLTREKGRKVKDLREIQRNIHLIDLEDKLLEKLATKVKIRGTENKGAIVIDYYSSEDLERIIEILLSR